MTDDDHSLNLYWHALNYRSAHSLHAEQMWQELKACVERLVQAEREAIYDHIREHRDDL